MSQQHENIKAAFETYVAENEKFSTKGGLRLLALARPCKK